MKACDICGAAEFTGATHTIAIDFDESERLRLDLCDKHYQSFGLAVNKWADQQFVTDFLEIEQVIPAT